MGDPYVDARTSRIWIHGDLHVENFGTYLSSEGVLVFDVNDFDEAYLGHFTGDLKRFPGSLALTCWQKRSRRRRCAGFVARSRLPQQTDHYPAHPGDHRPALHLDTASGPVLEALEDARRSAAPMSSMRRPRSTTASGRSITIRPCAG